MAVTVQPRTGTHQWALGTDPYNRVQRNAGNLALEQRVVIFVRDTLANRPAAGVIGRIFEVTGDTADNNGRQFWDTGAAWQELFVLNSRQAPQTAGPVGDVVGNSRGLFYGKAEVGDGGYSRVELAAERTVAGATAANVRQRIRRLDRVGAGGAETEVAAIDLTPGTVKATGARLHVDLLGKGNTGLAGILVDRDDAETGNLFQARRSGDLGNSIFRLAVDGARHVLKPANMGEVVDDEWYTDWLNARNSANAVEHVGAFHRRVAGAAHANLQYRYGRKVDGVWYDRLEFRHGRLVAATDVFEVTSRLDVPLMRSVQAYADVDEGTSSSAYVALPTAVNCLFTAPASGVVVIHIQANAFNTNGTEAWVSFDLYRTSDNVLMGGAQDGNAAATLGTSRSTAAAAVWWSGLTPGAQYSVQQRYRAGNGGTATLRARRTIVVPGL